MYTKSDLINSILAPIASSFVGREDIRERMYNRLNNKSNFEVKEMFEKYTGLSLRVHQSNLFILY